MNFLWNISGLIMQIFLCINYPVWSLSQCTLRFFLSKIFLNKERIFPLVFYARSLLPESSLTIYGSLRARKIGFFIQSQPGTLFRQIKLARIEDSRLPFRLHHFFVNEVRRHSSYYYDFQKELPYLGNGVCWFGIVGWVDVTDDESFFFLPLSLYLC